MDLRPALFGMLADFRAAHPGVAIHMVESTQDDRNAFVCTEMGAVRGLASKGLGVAVMPRTVAEEPGPPIELRPIGPER